MEIERLQDSFGGVQPGMFGTSDPKAPDTKVKVALRVRPMIPKELADKEQKCVTCHCNTNQIYIGKDRMFTFDKVFDDDSRQQEVYEACAHDLVLSSFNGYNATILAYGQTGSGKTFTMGSSACYDLNAKDIGIIPRTIRELFNEVDKRKQEAEFLIKVSFLEIYNEEIQDLLDTTSITNTRGYNKPSTKAISIREEKDGSINVYGVVEEKVNSYEELSACLERGSLHRSTGSTLMNETSSRSHAIFTIFLEMHKISDLVKTSEDGTDAVQADQVPVLKPNAIPTGIDETEFMTSKFHFVDLAGSERLKKTGASGAVMREGININRGLLALGNVISALTEDKGKYTHVPYRESKLTRILQDSLGGNSRTYMIACISPAESNFDESLNSLKYASRARSIKNKPIVNRDPQSALISQLKQQIQELQSELIQYKKVGNLDPAQKMAMSMPSPIKSPFSQSYKLHDEANNEIIKNLRIKLLASEKETNKVKAELQINKKALNESEISLYSVKRERDLLKILSERYKQKLKDAGIGLEVDEEHLQEVDGKNLYEEYNNTIEKLKADLSDKDTLNKELQIEFENLLKKADKDNELLLLKTKVIADLKKQMRKKDVLGKSGLADSTAASTSGSTSMLVERRNDETSVIDENDADDEDGDNELKSEDDEMMEKQFENNANLHRKELHLVDGHILEKEELLQKITQAQMTLESNLMDEMKHQYHNKIHQLEDEIIFIEKQRDEAINRINTSALDADKTKITAGYKQKITELETKVKDWRKKDREQANLMKLVQNQQSKLNQLADEIKKIKNQKVEMHKKMREEQEKYEKWKNSRQKELIQIKKTNQLKDSQINKLKIENRRKEEMYKKRTEDILTNFMSPAMIEQLKTSTGGRMRTNTKLSRRNTVLRKADFDLLLKVNTDISETDARNLLEYCLQRVFENLELHFLISKEEEALRRSEQELEEEQHKYSVIMLKKDKLEIEKRQLKEETDPESKVFVELQELDMQLNEIYTRIETQEEKIAFQHNKIQDLTRQSHEKESFDLDKALFKSEKLKKNINNYQLLLRILLGKFVNSNVEQYQLNEQVSHLSVESTDLKKRLEESEQKQRLTELQYQLNVTKLHKEYEDKQYLWMNNLGDDDTSSSQAADDKENINSESMSEEKQNNPQNNSNGFVSLAQARLKKQQKQSQASPGKKHSSQDQNAANLAAKQKSLEAAQEDVKRKDKQITDMARKQQNSDKIIETLKRKCEVLQLKYDQQKRQNAKEKFIGIEKRGDEHTEKGPNHQLSGSFGSITMNPTTNGPPSFMFSSVGSKKAAETKSTGSSHPSPYGLVQSRNMNIVSLKDRRKEEKERLHINTGKLGTSVGQSHSEPVSGDDIRARRHSSNTHTTTASAFSQSKGLSQHAKHAKSNSIVSKRQSSPGRTQSQFDSPQPRTSNPNEHLATIPSVTDNTSAFELESGSDRQLIEEKVLEGGPLAMSYNNNQWKNVASFDAQSGVLYSVVSYGNLVYTASNKTFKVWSLDTLQCMSEVNAHASMIKSMAIWPEKNVLVTASDKTINVWDLVSLQSLGTLRGHKDEVRALHVSNDMLISAGKGSASNSSIFTWDLRSLYPTDEREKNQDIFCMTSHDNTLYYGSRNHQVRRLNLTNMEALSPFEPPHFDAVTSLGIFKGCLVSGSRDKNLRLWNLENCVQNLKNTSYAHQDWVNVVQTNPSNSVLYSGSRDGFVKVWGISNSKLCCISDILAHSGSINSLCTVNDASSNLFVTASADRMVKIWKFDADESNALTTNKISNDDMVDEGYQSVNSYCDSPIIQSRSNSRIQLNFEDSGLLQLTKQSESNPDMTEGTVDLSPRVIASDKNSMVIEKQEEAP